VLKPDRLTSAVLGAVFEGSRPTPNAAFAFTPAELEDATGASSHFGGDARELPRLLVRQGHAVAKWRDPEERVFMAHAPERSGRRFPDDGSLEAWRRADLLSGPPSGVERLVARRYELVDPRDHVLHVGLMHAVFDGALGITELELRHAARFMDSLQLSVRRPPGKAAPRGGGAEQWLLVAEVPPVPSRGPQYLDVIMVGSDDCAPVEPRLTLMDRTVRAAAARRGVELRVLALDPSRVQARGGSDPASAMRERGRGAVEVAEASRSGAHPRLVHGSFRAMPRRA